MTRRDARADALAEGVGKSSGPQGRTPLINTEFSRAELQNKFFCQDVGSGDDGIGSLAQLAAMPGMPSKPAIRALIEQDPDFPILKRARLGEAHQIDLGRAAAYVRQHWEDGRKGAPRAARRLSDTLEALAALPGMPSVPTLRKFIAARPDFPLLERATPGKPHWIDIEAAAGFVKTHWRRQSRRSSPIATPLPLFVHLPAEETGNAPCSP